MGIFPHFVLYTVDTTIHFIYTWFMYCIIKYIKKDEGKRLPVILLNTQSEIWEFDTLSEAELMKDIFQTNSDSNHTYEVKKI